MDSTGTPFTTCSEFNFPGTFFESSVNNDDFIDFTLDSKLFFQVPGMPGTPVTFYVRVLDFRGDARPDMRYAIKISGAN